MKINKGGFTWNIRENTSDEAIVGAMVGSREYLDFLDIKPGDVVLDIGMNIGGFGVLAASKGAKVIGYEPHLETYLLAVENFKDNGLDAITHQKAVSNNKEESTLYLDRPMRKGSVYYSMLEAKDASIVKIECEDINDILKKYKPNKIKMDCEWKEYDIIMAINDWYDVEKMTFEYHHRVVHNGITSYVVMLDGKIVKDDGGYHDKLMKKLSEHFSLIEHRKDITDCKI